MKLNENQRTLLQLVLQSIEENMYDGEENVFIEDIFKDEIITEIKKTFRVGSVGTFERSGREKVSNIQYIVSVLKKCGYRVRFVKEEYVNGEDLSVLRLERKPEQ